MSFDSSGDQESYRATFASEAEDAVSCDHAVGARALSGDSGASILSRFAARHPGRPAGPIVLEPLVLEPLALEPLSPGAKTRACKRKNTFESVGVLCEGRGSIDSTDSEISVQALPPPRETRPARQFAARHARMSRSSACAAR